IYSNKTRDTSSLRCLNALIRAPDLPRTDIIVVRSCPGRHKAGNNTFSYFVTPNGFAVEYTAELDRVDDATWQPTVYEPKPALMDLWGTGVGGPQAMPRPAPDAGLFQAAEA